MEQPKWVKLGRFCELTGFTQKSVYALIKGGRWMLSREYKQINRRYFVNLEAYERWVEANG